MVLRPVATSGPWRSAYIPWPVPTRLRRHPPRNHKHLRRPITPPSKAPMGTANGPVPQAVVIDMIYGITARIGIEVQIRRPRIRSDPSLSNGPLADRNHALQNEPI